jgi:DNA-binding NarL/FixJ family response regulator
VSDQPVRVLVADAQALFRFAVRTALEEQPDLVVVAESENATEAAVEAERTRPDVALLDAGLPRPGVIGALERIGERAPSCRLVVVAAEADEELLFSAVVAGARAFITKDQPLEELLEITRGVASGRARVPEDLLGGLLDRLTTHRERRSDVRQRVAKLTRREQEVLLILARGGSNDAIARALTISRQTARTHVQNVLSKLGVHSRLEAAAVARQSHLAPPGAQPAPSER